LGGESVAGGKMKETGTTHWTTPNTIATNEVGFNALPAGYRNGNGSFKSIGDNAYFWSSTAVGAYRAWIRDLSYDDGNAYRSDGIKQGGFSVRCIKD